MKNHYNMKNIKLLLNIFIFGNLLIVIKAQNSTNELDDDNNNIESITISPYEYLIASRIVGGRNAADNQFPYQVLVNAGNSICGGSIISQNYILTAAHCISQLRGRTLVVTAPSNIVIRAGTTSINSGGTIARVADIRIHPNYRGFNNDIALLRLSTPLTFSNSIRSIPLATDTLPSGTPVTVSGWGGIRAGGPIASRLQYVVLNALSTAECQRLLRVTDSILCLSHRQGTGVCHGDSGGPAVSNGRLVGVANFVINTCATNAPDGYAKVSYHLNWIRQNANV